MNKKGFISTTIVFAFFILFISLLAFIMSSYTTNRVNNKIITSDIKKNLKIEIRPRFLYEAILEDNGGVSAIKGKGTPDFSKSAISKAVYDSLTEKTYPAKSKTSYEMGMYAAPDDYGTSYYFRGAVSNNWVKFAGFYWRIIRINGNNTVRLIYSGSTAPTEAQKVTMTDGKTLIDGNFNYSNIAEYVGYKYTVGEVHGTSTDSLAKETLESWYQNNLLSLSSKISDTLFCGDRTPSSKFDGYDGKGGTGTTTTHFGSEIRIYFDNSPILTCPNKLDSYTVKDSIKGNASLKYPVALISGDEMNMAGCSGDNKSFYLYTGDDYWTISPAEYMYAYISEANPFCFTSDGYLGSSADVCWDSKLRPVISLNSNVIATGIGEWNDPYIVQ